MASITEEWKGGTPAPAWRKILLPEFSKPYMKSLIAFLNVEKEHHTLCPEPKNIFRAFSLTDFTQIKVCILGQDPYHSPNTANGLAFSVYDDQPVPPSLKNMYKEIAADLEKPIPPNGDLVRWAEQGVFLLNTSLTVRQHAANSHRGKGWEEFTAAAIRALSGREDPVVFMLWGRNARDHARHIDGTRHLILEAAHPSPLSAYNGFFGCRHFSKANEFLTEHGKQVIDW